MEGVTRDMNIPENYEKLGKAGFVPKGAWSNTETYNRLGVVYYKGSSYIVVNDGVTGVTPSETDQNYIIMAAGQEEEPIAADLFEVPSQESPKLVYWDASTLNTPYKAGKTTNTQGMALVVGGTGSYRTVLAIVKGIADMFIHAKSENVTIDWTAIITERHEVVTRYDWTNDDSFPWRGFTNIDHKGECCMVYNIEDKILQINYTDANGVIRHAKFTPTSDTPLQSANNETESE